MFDINLIREQPEVVKKSLKDRQMDPAPVDEILKLDGDRRALLVKVEALKAERNTVSKAISQIKDPAERQQKIEAMLTLRKSSAVIWSVLTPVQA